MAPRPLRGKLRARNLALPFVVTAAASCTVTSTSTKKTAQPNGATPQHTVRGNGPARDANAQDHREGAHAPEHSHDHRGTAPAAHGVHNDHRDVSHTANPPPPQTNDTGRITPPNPQGTAPTTGPAKAADPKAPVVITNPPGPRQKPALKPAPKKGGKVITQADGSCIWVQDVKCPKGAACNPPPPKKVQCPPKIEQNSKAKR